MKIGVSGQTLMMKISDSKIQQKEFEVFINATGSEIEQHS
jgi:hypothetical protein